MRVADGDAGFLAEIGGVEGQERFLQLAACRLWLLWRGRLTRGASSILFGEHVGAGPEDPRILRADA